MRSEFPSSTKILPGQKYGTWLVLSGQSLVRALCEVCGKIAQLKRGKEDLATLPCWTCTHPPLRLKDGLTPQEWAKRLGITVEQMRRRLKRWPEKRWYDPPHPGWCEAHPHFERVITPDLRNESLPGRQSSAPASAAVQRPMRRGRS